MRNRENYSYPVTIERDGDFFVLSFRDIPEALAQVDASDEWRIEEEAREALAIAISYYFKNNEKIPSASAPRKGELVASLPLSLVSKIILRNTMIKNGVRPADLARRLDIPTSEVARIINPKCKTKIDTMAAAVSASGGSMLLSATI